MSDTEQTDLDQLLDGAGPADAQPASEPVQPTGDTTISAAPPADTTRQPEAEPAHVPWHALKDERRKRQELERRVQEFEAQLRQHQQAQQQPAPPSWDLEPDQAAALLQRQVEQIVEQRTFQLRLDTSERDMMRAHPDYNDVVTVFVEAAQADPVLKERIRQHPYPAEFAYQAGKRMMLMREIGDDPDTYRAKLEAEILAKHGIGMTPTTPDATARAKPAAAQVPRSLASTASQQPRDTRGRFEGPMPLEDIIG